MKTTICFYKSEGIHYGFEEQGHTGFADAGEDILCSAISAMTMLIINAIEVTYNSFVDYNIDEVTTNITLVAKSALPKYESDEKKKPQCDRKTDVTEIQQIKEVIFRLP